LGRGDNLLRILLVEDNRQLSDSLMRSLNDEGYAVDAAYDGEEGEGWALSYDYDAIILDIMLPKKDGLDVCRALRRKRIQSPIIMLTARDTVDDRVDGLDSGADDYLVKPFALNELLARLRALLRRDSDDKSPELRVGDLSLNPATHVVERCGKSVILTAKEFALLEYFMRNRGRVITRDMAQDHIWSYDFQATSNVVDVYVRRLRRKIDDPFDDKLLETIRGAGYRLVNPDKTQ
jgi:DNA-binding response OmpR family regulator